MVGIFALIGAALWLVVSCQNSEKDRFLSCFDDAVSGNMQDLYYANTHHDAVDSYVIHDFVGKCYGHCERAIENFSAPG